MLSVRVAAAGAVASVCASLLTVPASACDFDRYQKKCDREIAAREQAEAAPTAPRRAAKRSRTSAQRAKAVRADRRVRSAPRFATRRDEGFKPASAESRAVVLPETVMSRRFRGFIDPRPVGDNAFESMRKPHLNAHDFHAAMILQPVQVAQAALVTKSDAAPTEQPPRQDRVAPAPAAAIPATSAVPAAPAPMTLASAESRPVALPPLASKPAAAPPVAPPTVMQASVIETASPSGPGSFSFHTLVLALCGALGAASALRFIVGA